MPNVETQLKRYADAVESAYGLESDSDPSAPSGKQQNSDRRYVPPLAVAAVIIAVAVFLSMGDRVTEVVTDDPAATDPTAAEEDRDRHAEVGGGLELDYPRLLPSPENWLLTSATLTEQSASTDDSSNVLAFAHADGRLSILVVSALAGERQLLAEAEIERQHDRAVIWWSENEQRLALMTFDTDDRQLRAAAEELRRSGDSYVLPGTTILTQDNGERLPTGQQSTMVFSAMIEGEPDRAQSIEQAATPGTISDLYRTLFDASDFGPMNRLEVGGAPAYLMTGEFGSYGLAFIDGLLVTWQGSTADVDLTGFVSSLSPTGQDELELAVEAAERLRQETIDEALAANPPDRSESDFLPRFVLDPPWRLESVYDESLWTAEQRAEYETTLDSMMTTGQVETGRIWFQLFAASDRPDEGVVTLEAREATISPATITVGSPTDRPITVLGYEGNLGEFDRVRLISVRKGTTSLEIRSGRLSAEELVAFAERLIDRSGDGLSGFDLADDDFTTIFDRAAPPADEEPADIDFRRYHQVWVIDGRQVWMRVTEIVASASDTWPPPGFNEARDSALGVPPPSPVDGTPFTAQTMFGREELSWLNESAGVVVALVGEPDDTRRAAESVLMVSEAEWQSLVGPAAVSFEEAMNELVDPTPRLIPDE